MAKTDNLTDFLTDIADAIRAKKGTTNKINPQDFSAEIASISGSGGGDSSIGYLDVSGLDGDLYDYAISLAILGKKTGYILPTNLTNLLGGDTERFTAIAVDFAQECYVYELGSNTLQLSQVLDVLGLTDIFSSIPRLTKEQFYSLE